VGRKGGKNVVSFLWGSMNARRKREETKARPKTYYEGGKRKERAKRGKKPANTRTQKKMLNLLGP